MTASTDFMRRVVYDYDDRGNILLPAGAPFDGKPVLIKTNIGMVEAWWDEGQAVETLEGREYEGYEWVCYDAAFTCALDDATHWMPLPAVGDEP